MELESTPLRLITRNKYFCKPKHAYFESNFSINLRKSNRASLIKKKRAELNSTSSNQALSLLLNSFKNHLNSPTLYDLLNFMPYFSESLSSFDSISYELLKQERFFSLFFKFLSSDFSEAFKLEISSIFKSICTKSEKVPEFIEAIGYILAMTDTENLEILDNCLSSLGMLSYYSEHATSQIISLGFFSSIQSIYSIVRNTEEVANLLIWLIANLTKAETSFKLDHATLVVKFLSESVKIVENETNFDALRAFCCISYRDASYNQILINFKVHVVCLGLIKSSNSTIQLLAIKIMANLMAESIYTQVLINLGVLDCLFEALSSSRLVRREALLALLNIAKGSPGQIAVMVEHPIINLIVKAATDLDNETKISASHILRNISLNGCLLTAAMLIENGVLEVLKQGLEDYDQNVMRNCLATLVKLIEISDREGDHVRLIEELGIFDMLSQIELRNKKDILKIVEKLFEL